MERDDIVHLATAGNPAEAHLWEQALRAEGIRCRTVGDYLDASFGDIPGIQAEVWVHREDLARAQELLAAHRRAAETAEEEEEE